MYIFETLFNTGYQCYKTIKKIWTSLPNEVPYPINNKMYYSNPLLIPIGVNKKSIQYLRIGGDCSHTYIVGQ